MVYLFEAILVLPVNIGMAAWHACLTKKQRPIQHGWWAFAYAALLLLGVITLKNYGLLSLISWKSGVFTLACLIGRLVVFNVALN